MRNPTWDKIKEVLKTTSVITDDYKLIHKEAPLTEFSAKYDIFATSQKRVINRYLMFRIIILIDTTLIYYNNLYCIIVVTINSY